MDIKNEIHYIEKYICISFFWVGVVPCPPVGVQSRSDKTSPEMPWLQDETSLGMLNVSMFIQILKCSFSKDAIKKKPILECIGFIFHIILVWQLCTTSEWSFWSRCYNQSDHLVSCYSNIHFGKEVMGNLGYVLLNLNLHTYNLNTLYTAML